MAQTKTKKRKAAKKIRQITNLDFLRECTSGDPKKMEWYIQMYLKSASELLDKLREGAQKRDWKEMRDSAHTLRPMLVYVGLDFVSSDLKVIEKNSLAKTNFKAIRAAFDKVEPVCEASFKELKSYLGKNPG